MSQVRAVRAEVVREQVPCGNVTHLARSVASTVSMMRLRTCARSSALRGAKMSTCHHVRHPPSRAVTRRHVPLLASRAVTRRHVPLRASRAVTRRHVPPRAVTRRHE